MHRASASIGDRVLLQQVDAERAVLDRNAVYAWRGAALAIVCIVLGPWAPDVSDHLGLSRAGVQAGEYWRLLTGHLVHVSWPHVALNVAALLVLQPLFGRELSPAVCAVAFIWLSLTTSAALLLTHTTGTYVGLSGVLHGLYALGACLAVRRDRWLAAAVLTLLIGKVWLEQWRGPAAGMRELIGAPVAIEAHLYGLAAGCVLGVAMAAVGVARAGAAGREN